MPPAWIMGVIGICSLSVMAIAGAEGISVSTAEPIHGIGAKPVNAYISAASY